MSEKEINYWLETFEKTKHTFMSKDGKTLSFYDTFKTIKDLQHEITKLKGVIETYEILIKANNINNWNEFKKWLEDSFYWSYYEENMSSGWVVEIMKEKMQELENRKV